MQKMGHVLKETVFHHQVRTKMYSSTGILYFFTNSSIRVYFNLHLMMKNSVFQEVIISALICLTL